MTNRFTPPCVTLEITAANLMMGQLFYRLHRHLDWNFNIFLSSEIAAKQTKKDEHKVQVMA